MVTRRLIAQSSSLRAPKTRSLPLLIITTALLASKIDIFDARDDDLVMLEILDEGFAA